MGAVVAQPRGHAYAEFVWSFGPQGGQSLRGNIFEKTCTNTMCDVRVKSEDETKGGSFTCFNDPESGTLRILAAEEGDIHGFECICVLVDPGASASAIPAGECPDVPTIEIDKPRAGHVYEAAGRHRITNAGEGQ